MQLNKWLGSVANAGRELLSKKDDHLPDKTLEDYCSDLLSTKGEAMGTAIAIEVVNAYERATEEQKLAFFFHLLEHYSPNADDVIKLANEYKEHNDFKTFVALNEAVEAPRQTLFRRINMAPNGTKVIVGLRCDLLRALKQNPELKPIDFDLRHILTSWFNRGFLSLKEISWDTQAVILEKLIKYEAVHSMSGWGDLKKRLGKNRRCYGFFHPSLPGEPLIFVEVALVVGLADSVEPLINPSSDDPAEYSQPDTAIFYSISNCQQGLAGISFGNFLIKQVVMELKKELPELEQFSTLSPIPGFRRWLSKEMEEKQSSLIDPENFSVLERLKDKDWHKSSQTCEFLKPILMKLCANYLMNAKRGKNPFDSVAKFHLGNGARIERLNWMGDISENGIAQSAGILVNYFYDITQVEENHECFVNDGIIITSKDFLKQLPA